jgi:hypothetical protein
MIFGPTDSFQGLHDAYWDMATPVTGYTRESQCETIVRARGIGEVSIKAGLTLFVQRPDIYGDNIDWIARHGLGLLSEGARRPILEALASDPPRACLVYMRQPDLTDDEDALLLGLWLPTMKAMRKRHEAGTLPRRKGAVDA